MSFATISPFFSLCNKLANLAARQQTTSLNYRFRFSQKWFFANLLLLLRIAPMNEKIGNFS
jgi:hypothetical protein